MQPADECDDLPRVESTVLKRETGSFAVISFGCRNGMAPREGACLAAVQLQSRRNHEKVKFV
jgi:hypothetical protein